MHGGDTTEVDLCAALARRLGAWRSWLFGVPDAGVVLAMMGDLALGTPMVVPVLGEMPVRCADVRDLGKAARAVGTACIVDNSLPGSHGCAAVRLGAHVSVEELGHGCACVGISKDAELVLPDIVKNLESLPRVTGAQLAELVRDDAQGGARHRLTSDAAAVVAAYLRCHPQVRFVRYPGLRDDPSFEVAARTLSGGFGAVVDYALADSVDGWRRVTCDETDPRSQVLALESDLASTARSVANREGSGDWGSLR